MYPFRKELVGKRFLCVRDNTSRSSTNRTNSRSNRLSDPLDYQWKCGIIRACTQQDSSHPDQKVLVEYDNEDWTTREWLQVFCDSWKIFLVEKNMVWAQRVDPNYPRRSLLWPALTFYPLVDKHGLDEKKFIGVEFLGDHLRAFCQTSEMRPYQEDDGLQPALRNNNQVLEELVNWQTLQKSQGILIHGPFTLTGFRVQVYREKCRQWFSAVITLHDLVSREMEVMDDTVLQTHRINPRLVMVLLLANEVELDSMLRGDLVRVLPVRRNRQAQVVITSSYTSTTPNSTPGNSMWQFLNDMWRDPSSTTQVQTSSHSRQTIQKATNSMTPDRETRTTDSSRNHKRQLSIDPQPTTDKDTAACHKPNPDSSLPLFTGDGLEQDRKGPKEFRTSLPKQEHENSPKNHSLCSNPSPVAAPFRHSSPLRSPIASPIHHYQSPYSSLENVSNSNSSPQSVSKLNVSPQRPFGSPRKSSPLHPSSTMIRASPVNNRSPPQILDSQQQHFGSPSHPFNQTPPKRQYTPPSSSSSFSPLRSNKLSPVLSSPAMHGHTSLQNCGLPISPACINPMGHCHDTKQLMGPCSCNTRHPAPQNILTNQLYALQFQQQRQIQNQQFQQLQHEQSLSQCYMKLNHLQMMAEQLKSYQQGALSPEQRDEMNYYYNQIMSQYQQANLLKYHSAVSSQESTLLPTEQQIQVLKEQMQAQFGTDNRKLNNFKWQQSIPEKDQFQALLSHMHQNANVEHLPKFYGDFTNQKSSVQQVEDESVKDHVARLKRFIPSKQVEQLQANSQTSCTSSPSLDTKPIKDILPISTPPSTSVPSISSITEPVLPLVQTAENQNDNKTDDQKVVDAMVRKPSVSECPSTSVESTNTLMTTSHGYIASSVSPQTEQKHNLEDQLVTQETNNDAPFGFDGIEDDVKRKTSPATTSLALNKSFTGSTVGGQKISSKVKTRKGKDAVVSTEFDHKSSEQTSLDLNTSSKSDKMSGRESVIKYVVNKSEPLVSSLNVSNTDVSSLDAEPLPFSVDQLLEFHKTSAQAAVKIFEESNEMVKPPHAENQPKQGKKRKKEGQPKPENKQSKECSTKKTQPRCAKQTKSHSSKKIQHIQVSKEKLSEGFENKPLWSGDELNADNDCKKLKVEHQKSQVEKSSEKRPSDSFLHEVTCSGPSKDPSSERLMHSQLTSSNEIDSAMHLLQEDKTDLQVHNNSKIVDWRSSRQNQNHLSTTNSAAFCNTNNGPDSTAAIPVNFVADQEVKSLNTVSKATEPVSAASLMCGTEYVVQQIEACSETSADSAQLKSETTRQRKKSRKVIENELNTSKQNKIKEEENEKVKKKLKNHQKTKLKSKEKTTDDIDEEETGKLTTDPKNKKSKKTAREETPEDQKGKEKLDKDSKNKKSKKTIKEETQEVKETRTTNFENEETSVKEITAEKNQATKKPLVCNDAQSNHEDLHVKQDDLQMNFVDRNDTATSVATILEDKDKAVIEKESNGSLDSVKSKIRKSSGGKSLISKKEKLITDKTKMEYNMEKRKQEKKNKHSKTKEKQSNEQKNKSKTEKLKVRQDYSYKELNQKECSTVEETVEKREDQYKNQDENAEENKEDSGIPSTNDKQDVGKAAPDDTGCSVQNTTEGDEENTSKEIKKQVSGSKKSNTEKTKTIKKRKQDITSEELSPIKKKQKLKEPAEEYFLQSSGCLAFSKLPRCRDCRDKEENTSENSQECCRFTLFRRLKKKKRSERVQVAGFLAPENAEPADFEPWIAHKEVFNTLSKEEALYIISNVADEFCSLVQEEKGAKVLKNEGNFVAYKRAVIGLREMCDACATTIFNIHWVCQKCGFGVCLDCYELRIKEKTMLKCGKKAFEFKWFNCMPGLTHQPKNLTIAQIIPDEVLDDLAEQLHYIRSRWNIGKKCPCNFEPDKVDKIQLPAEASTESCNPKIQLDTAHVNEKFNPPDPSIEVNQDSEEQGEEAVKDVTKKTIMERVRERLREKIEAQKASPAEKPVKEEHTMTSDKALKKGVSDTPETTPSISVDNTSDVSNSDECSKDNEKQTGNEDNDLKKTSIEVKTCQTKENSEETTKEDSKLTDDQGIINMSSGLSLLMDYDSSSDDSQPSTPTKPSSSTQSSFNFNLGLLALVASNEQVKRNEVSDSVQQPQEDENNLLQQNNDKRNWKLEKEKLGDWFKRVEDEQMQGKEENKCSEENKSSIGESTSMTVTMETDLLRNQHSLDAPRITKECPAPHSLLCNGRLLRLHEPHHPGNQEAFAKRWKEGKPVLVSDIDKLLDGNLWSPQSFEKEFGEELADVVNCRTGKTLENFAVGAFWKGFESVQDRIKDSNGEPMLLKLKDWPPAADFSEKLPLRFKNLMDHIPLPEYARRDGPRNLASRLPEFFVKPDLGPKMYNAYGSAAFPTEGTTNLHIDMSDAVNIMVYVGVPREQSAGEKERKDAINAVDVACDEIQQQRVRRETARIGALWHIFDVDDADKIRELLHEVAKERKLKYPAHHDPIHDQCFYLDYELRERLKKDYNVEGYAVCQCLGDGVFIPAGAPHQVRNLYSCIKIAEDFVSPERIGQCFKTTQEFRHLTDKHSNHEDKLQIKNIIYHAVKDAVYVLKHHKSEQTNSTEINK